MDCSGLGVALATPFREDGGLDEPALRRLAKHVAENGADYLVALGTTGEAVTQTLQERLHLLEVLFEEVGDRIPIVIGAGGYDTHAIAKEMRLYAQHFPAKAFLSVTPYYNKPTAEAVCPLRLPRRAKPLTYHLVQCASAYGGTFAASDYPAFGGGLSRAGDCA